MENIKTLYTIIGEDIDKFGCKEKIYDSENQGELYDDLAEAEKTARQIVNDYNHVYIMSAAYKGEDEEWLEGSDEFVEDISNEG